MKINKYILLLSATMVVVSCDLDKFPEGSTVTQDQKMRWLSCCQTVFHLN